MEGDYVEDLVRCRLCTLCETVDKMELPCRCQGTMAYVHIPCLQMWMTITKADHCEVCLHPYKIFRTRKYWFGLIFRIIIAFLTITMLAYSPSFSPVVCFKFEVIRDSTEENSINTIKCCGRHESELTSSDVGC